MNERCNNRPTAGAHLNHTMMGVVGPENGTYRTGCKCVCVRCLHCKLNLVDMVRKNSMTHCS